MDKLYLLFKRLSEAVQNGQQFDWVLSMNDCFDLHIKNHIIRILGRNYYGYYRFCLLNEDERELVSFTDSSPEMEELFNTVRRKVMKADEVLTELIAELESFQVKR